MVIEAFSDLNNVIAFQDEVIAIQHACEWAYQCEQDIKSLKIMYDSAFIIWAVKSPFVTSNKV